MARGRPIRVPLVSAYNSRASAALAADSSTAYAGIAIVGIVLVGKTVPVTSKDARYVNCFAQTVNDPVTGSKKVYCVKRPGFGTLSTPAAGEKGFAVHVWAGKGSGNDVISAFGAANSTIYNGATSLGAITGQATGITETFVSTTPTLVVSSSDNTGWYYDTGVAVMTKITDVDFPGNAGKTLAGTFAHVDGFACIMTADGGLYAGDLNSLTGWSASSFDSANAYPDNGVGCIRNGNFILAFGTESLQFFYNRGLSPFPLAKAEAKTVKIGCIGASAIAQIADTVFWCGSTPQGGLSVFQYDGSVSRVSTPEIDVALITAAALNISMTTIRFYGRSFVIVIAALKSYAYCVEEKFWFELESSTANTPLWYKCAANALGGTMVNYAVSNVSTSGKVFLMNNASLVFTDNGSAYTARAQLPNMDLGTNRLKYWNDVELACDEETSASPISLLYSDDDYQNYTTFGTADLADPLPRWNRTGASKKRAWVLTHAANTPMRVEALELPNVEIAGR